MKISRREIHRVAYACDASVYRLIPDAVAWPENESHIIELFAYARQSKIPLTFRAGGTSLSGQAVTNGTLVDLSRHWRHAEILDNGSKVRVRPGIVGAHVNDFLKPLARKIGPDPASISAAMMGGILANNSSGMCCGTEQNAYRTLSAMRVVLPDGTVVDSRDPNANEKLRASNPQIYQGLLNLRNKVLNNTSLKARIQQKYRYKNTTGYGLNSLIDFSTPVDILTHLMIGSEGTLGFISEAELETVPLNPFATTGILFFANPIDACQATIALRDSGAAAVELMDRAALRAVENQNGAPAILKTLSASTTAMLVEYQAESQDALNKVFLEAQVLTKNLPLETLLPFTTDAATQNALWKIRKGTFPAVGASRQQGTAVLIEDVLFPLERLADGVNSLQMLFKKFDYADANIFGHAKDGNLHFVLSQSFASQKEIARYDAFMREVVNLVAVEHNGSLKAEHGTGRNMAPFVKTEWGEDGFDIMKELKSLFDPNGILNPDVVVSTNENIHLENLKDLPPVHSEVDKCIECGYCEPICPSEKITLSPRRRIIVSREMERLKRSGNLPQAKRIHREFEYEGVATCAADGLCATQCPVSINTGTFVKVLRSQSHSALTSHMAWLLNKNLGRVETFLRFALRTAHTAAFLFTHKTLRVFTACFRLPRWTRWMPKPQNRSLGVAALPQNDVSAVLFPTCVNRTFGNIPGEANASRNTTLVALCEKAGVGMAIPQKSKGQCCGMPFFSKGFSEQGKESLAQLIDAMWEWSHQGALPVVVDNSPCTQTILDYAKSLSPEHVQKFSALRILDIVEFTHDALLPKLSIAPVEETAFVYPVCSVTKMNLTPKLRAIAERCATNVVMPLRPACCGQAGDRGFLHPELTQSATQKIEWSQACQCENPSGHYSTSRTCEIALSENANAAYSSLLELVWKACHHSDKNFGSSLRR
jgi:D-lactate dehydrogenase